MTTETGTNEKRRRKAWQGRTIEAWAPDPHAVEKIELSKKEKESSKNRQQKKKQRKGQKVRSTQKRPLGVSSALRGEKKKNKRFWGGGRVQKTRTPMRGGGALEEEQNCTPLDST